MALIVEDGTGLPDAECYCSVAYLESYLDKRGIAHTHSDSQLEAAILIAAQDWIDGQHTFRGEKVSASQSMKFPTDLDSLPDNIPLANAKAAYLQLQNALLVDSAALDLDGEVESSSKSVGTLSKSVSYRSGTSQRYSRIIPRDLTMLLQPYLAYSSTRTRVM
jgi:hypothetical protein